MAPYIVDASVVIERLTKGIHTDHAKILFQRSLVGDTFVVPEFCLLECTNVLWKFVRFQGMPQQQAYTLLRDLRALPLKRIPVKATLNKALKIGLTHNLAIYDSTYIALATRLKTPIITLDKKQEQVAILEKATVLSLMDFS